MKKILSAILAVMLLVGALVIPSAAALPVVIDKESGAVRIDTTQCNGCGLCVGVCPFGAIEKEEA